MGHTTTSLGCEPGGLPTSPPPSLALPPGCCCGMTTMGGKGKRCLLYSVSSACDIWPGGGAGAAVPTEGSVLSVVHPKDPDTVL